MEWNLLIKKDRIIIITFIVLQIKFCLAGSIDSKSLVESISNTLQYPPSRIKLMDLSDSPKAKEKGGVLSLVLDSNDGTFSQMTVGIAKEGNILTTTLLSECDEAVKKSNAGNGNVKKISLPDEGYGYTGLVTLGPGGAGERIVATWPKYKIDIQVAIIIPGEGIKEDKQLSSYQELVNNGGAALSEKILKSMLYALEEFKISENKKVSLYNSSDSTKDTEEKFVEKVNNTDRYENKTKQIKIKNLVLSGVIFAILIVCFFVFKKNYNVIDRR